MTDQAHIDYARVERAIGFIAAHRHANPSRDDIAAAVHLSPFHFQRLFTKWAGVSPKKFIQFLVLASAKARLRRGASILDAAYGAGLSGGGRLHDLFVNIEAMTPGDYKNGGAGLQINYNFDASPFGPVLIASTYKGICHLAFTPSHDTGFAALCRRFPQAGFAMKRDEHQQAAAAVFHKDWAHLEQIKLHLRGTPFQIKIWEALLKIPMGALARYGDIARHIGQPSAARAVGRAITSNPIGFLIPCHRVIQKNGKIGGYMWGATRKTALLGWEAAHSGDAA